MPGRSDNVQVTYNMAPEVLAHRLSRESGVL